MNKKSKILVVSHLFYPEIKIGGNRWFKFTNELAKFYTVDLLTSFSKEKRDYDYSQKIQKVYFYNNSYPKVLSNIKLSFWQKINYRLSLLFLKLYKPSKNPYDKGILDEKSIEKKLNELLKLNDYQQVFVTGAPFSLTYIIVKVCSKNNIKVWTDLRDPWIWGVGYGMTIISTKRIITEKERQDFVIKNSNFISVPVETMHLHLINCYKEFANKIHLLPHGFDSEIMPKLQKKSLKHQLNELIFGGTIYDGVESYMSLFFRVLENRKLPYNFNLYVSNFEKTTFLNSNESINFYKPISSQLFLNKVHESNFYLAFYPNVYKDYISTKIIEIIMVKTPIILVCPEGKLSSYITSNHLGIHILPENIENDIMNWDLLIKDFYYNSEFDANNLSYANLTQKILKIIK